MTEITAKLCLCNNNYFVDRYRNGKESCPACDPELGKTAQERIELYKKLIGTPINTYPGFYATTR